jgi:hypothetical protein
MGMSESIFYRSSVSKPKAFEQRLLSKPLHLRTTAISSIDLTFLEIFWIFLHEIVSLGSWRLVDFAINK